jgi:outer membrane immunogenic protein
MKKLLLAGVAGVALMAGVPAHAADLGARQPYKAPPVVAPLPPPPIWTGCYIGGNIGGGFGTKKFSDQLNEFDNTPFGFAPFFVGNEAPGSLNVDTSGVVGGGQIGCDYQFTPYFLAGIVGTGDAAGLSHDSFNNFFDTRFAKHFHAKTDWLADISGRIGVTWGQFLLYGKGGVAWVGDKYHVNDFFDLAQTFPVQFDHSETRTGFVVGVGGEYLFWDNLSAFIEYDFYDFGSKDVNFGCTFTSATFPIGFTSANCGSFGPIKVDQQINVVKGGINWRFNWWGGPPVTARY